MSHPFEQIFEKALERSRGDENHVLGEAEKLRESGYAGSEIYTVLRNMKQSHINPADEEILDEALEEFAQYVEIDSISESEGTTDDWEEE